MPRIVICGDMTISGLIQPLQQVLKGDWQVEELGFNLWLVDMLDPASNLNKHQPDYLITLLSPRYLQMDPEAERNLEHYLSGIETWKGDTQVLFSQITYDPLVPDRLIEAPRLQLMAERLNERLRRFQNGNGWFHLLDMASFFMEQGLAKVHDSRFEVLARMYISPGGAKPLAAYIARYLRALTTPPKKVLVLDLDNTLWGGILGEEIIQVGAEGVGYAYDQFQRALLVLKNHGVLLAICSKNNENEVLEVFEENPGMVLKITDFAAYRINWLSKVENLQSLAQELNLGLDSFAFFDDSPFEREQLRRMLPEIDVIDVPKDAADFVQALSDYTGFDKLYVTEEDSKRAQLYQNEVERKAIQKKSASLEDFYQSLQMVAELSPIQDDSFERVHQLIQKTNQFNLTTKRYSEKELRELMRSGDCAIYTLRLKDKLGDSGLTGVLILKMNADEWEIDTLLLSCRIIGRTVEYALIQWLAGKARQQKVKRIVGRFIPTKKNQPAASFYPDAGFDLFEDRWVLDVERLKIPKNYVTLEEKR